jgi:hypothetical protein
LVSSSDLRVDLDKCGVLQIFGCDRGYPMSSTDFVGSSSLQLPCLVADIMIGVQFKKYL